jgi:nucleoside-diphosphate-sugar epimerase
MSVVQQGSKILVTGGNGYIGVSAICLLLERGYAVRATVRRKVDWLRELFEEKYKNKFEVVVVEDMTKVDVGFLILMGTYVGILTVATLGRSV